MALIDTMLRSAILSNMKVIKIAKEILLSVGNLEWFRDSLPGRIGNILRNEELEEEDKYFYYRNIAQLFYELRFSEELENFLNKYCKQSTDQDVHEIYEDFI